MYLCAVNTTKKEVIIVDAGNTRIKVALFQQGEIIRQKTFLLTENEEFKSFASQYNFPPLFVSSVLSETNLSHFLGETKNAIFFNSSMKLPVKIDYLTPATLGLDRLANAAAIATCEIVGPKVAIDLGTCIKFDFVSENGDYKGGSISPGLRMRYAALHQFTGKLPLLDPNPSSFLVGTDSKSSIHAGVMQGIQGELNHFMSSYLQDYQGLTFFVTGGDAKFFEFPVKNNIFADENLTLTGLYKIYLLNA